MGSVAMASVVVIIVVMMMVVVVVVVIIILAARIHILVVISSLLVLDRPRRPPASHALGRNAQGSNNNASRKIRNRRQVMEEEFPMVARCMAVSWGTAAVLKYRWGNRGRSSSSSSRSRGG